MDIVNAVLLSLVAGLATGLGGAIVAALGKISLRTYDALLGFAAGVMIAIATLGLIHEATTQGNALAALAGVGSGAAALLVLDRLMPHECKRLDHTGYPGYRHGLLLFAAMTLHNIPEGLAVGTSYAAQPRLGLLLALAIALHNIPEGIAIAAPFAASGMSRWRCMAWTAGSGMAEPIAALMGALFVTLFRPLLPFSLAFAGGAMLYVASNALIPESHSHGHEREATLGFVGGFMLLLALLRWM